MTWFDKFPQLNDGFLRDLKKVIDDGFRSFTRSYGDAIESLFEPLRHFLVWSENLLTSTPWPIILIAIAAIAWGASRSARIVVACILTLCLIGAFGMWDDTMKTISMILTSTLLAIAVGLPIGILMSRYWGVALADTAVVLYSLFRIVPQISTMVYQKNLLDSSYASYRQVVEIGDKARALRQPSGTAPFGGLADGMRAGRARG